MLYAFGDYEIDTDLFELRQAGQVRKVEPQVFALLELLVANHTRMVTKDEINLHVWGGRVVSDAVVNSRMRAARQVIGDNGKDQKLIRTVHGRGFRFVGAVTGSSPSLIMPDTDLVSDAPGNLAGDEGERPSIAVLPLQLMSPDERYGTLGDAVSQEVIMELARLHWLFVISRGSSFRFRNSDVDLAEIGRVLGARYVLSGTIRFSGDESVVTVELAQSSDGRVVWADRFNCAVDELLQLRLTIAGHIVSAIETRIQIAEAERASRLPTENLDAWSAYHRGLWHMYRFNKHDNEIAARMFDRAVTADPGFARGYAGLSFTHFQNVLVGYSQDIDLERRKTRELAEKSLDLDPLDPFINLTMGRSEWISGNFSDGLPWLDRSVELSPNFAFAHYNRGLLESLLGEGEAGEASVKKAIALSPIDPLNYAMLATVALSHISRGEYADAAQWAARAVRAPNAHVHIYVIAAIASELSGKQAEARNLAASIRERNRGFLRDDFLRSFDFQSEKTSKDIGRALDKLGL